MSEDQFLGKPFSYWMELQARIDVLEQPKVIEALLAQLTKEREINRICKQHLHIIRASLGRQFYKDDAWIIKNIENAVQCIDENLKQFP